MTNAAQELNSQLKKLALKAITSGHGASLATNLEALQDSFKGKLDDDSFAALQSSITALSRELNDATGQIAAVEEQLHPTTAKHEEVFADLHQKVQQLQKQVQQLQEGHREERNNVGAQLAYTLDGVVSAAVLGPGDTYNLRELQEVFAGGEVDAAVLKRWRAVVAFLEQRAGMPLDSIVNSLVPLRRQRHGLAHGTKAERRATSKAAVEQWAANQNSFIQVAVNRLLLILEPLTCPGQPLCPLNNEAISKAFQLEA